MSIGPYCGQRYSLQNQSSLTTRVTPSLQPDASPWLWEIEEGTGSFTVEPVASVTGSAACCWWWKTRAERGKSASADSASPQLPRSPQPSAWRYPARNQATYHGWWSSTGTMVLFSSSKRPCTRSCVSDIFITNDRFQGLTMMWCPGCDYGQFSVNFFLVASLFICWFIFVTTLGSPDSDSRVVTEILLNTPEVSIPLICWTLSLPDLPVSRDVLLLCWRLTSMKAAAENNSTKR